MCFYGEVSIICMIGFKVTKGVVGGVALEAVVVRVFEG